MSSFTHANDAVRANQLDEVVLDGALGIALAIRVNVAEITDANARRLFSRVEA